MYAENTPRKKRGNEADGLPYDETPMSHAAGEDGGCLEQINEYGTYEIQRTADTENFFPAIAQGLPRGMRFRIGRTELEQEKPGD